MIDAWEQRTGRSIELCPVPWREGASVGGWHRGPDSDILAYPTHASREQQEMIILHELGHLVFEHSDQCALGRLELHLQGPDLQPAAFAHLLSMEQGGAAEREAELFAHLLREQVRTANTA